MLPNFWNGYTLINPQEGKNVKDKCIDTFNLGDIKTEPSLHEINLFGQLLSKSSIKKALLQCSVECLM
jgi:phage pi2 protein 07